jgi:hypothetical protein
MVMIKSSSTTKILATVPSDFDWQPTTVESVYSRPNLALGSAIVGATGKPCCWAAA